MQEQVALGGQAVSDFLLGGRLHRIYALGRGGEVFRHAFDHVAGKLKVSIALRVPGPQRRHQRQRAHAGHAAGQGHGFIQQGGSAGGQLGQQLLPRHLGQQGGSHRFAADDHVQRRLYSQGTRQALCAACAGQQAQFHLGQAQLAIGRGHAVVAGQRQLQPAAHANAVQGGKHGLAAAFHHGNQGVQIGFGKRGIVAKLGNVGPAGKRLARAGQHNRLHLGLVLGALQASGQRLAHGQPQAIDRGQVKGQHSHIGVDLVVNRHHRSPWINMNRTNVLKNTF